MLKCVFETPSVVWDLMADIRVKQIEAINTLLDEPIVIDNDIINEFDRVLNIEIGIINNELNFIEHRINEIKSETSEVISGFYRKLALLSDAHGRTLDEKMMLPMLVELENLAIEKEQKRCQTDNT